MIPLSLTRFVEKCGGAHQASKHLRIPFRTLRSYLYQEKLPRPKAAYQLMLASQGKLDFNSIYQPFFGRESKHLKLTHKQLRKGY